MLVAVVYTSILLFTPLTTAKTFHQSYADLNLNSIATDHKVASSTLAFAKDILIKIKDSPFLKDKDKIQGNVGAVMLSALQHVLSDKQKIKSIVTDGFGLHENFVKPLDKLHDELSKIDFKPSAEVSSPDINMQILNAVKNVFGGQFGDLSILPLPTQLLDVSMDAALSDSDATAASVWMLVKSTWQRILAYVDDNHALHRFMQLTPVKIIDKILSIGDEFSLMGFLAQKLHPDFAKFLVNEINPHLGPLRNFDTFYNYTKEYSMDSIVDYFMSPKFINTINALSKFVSAYFDDTFSDDVVDQYIAFISFNNPELKSFYKSIVSSQKDHKEESTIIGRQKRDEFNKIINGFRYDGYDFEPKDKNTLSQRQAAAKDTGYGGGSDTGGGGGYGSGYASGSYGGGGGGYGGGGYGHQPSSSTVDPAVLLSSVALGALLGFLLFRLINGSRIGKRDINDGSLSLWLSDLPDAYLPWSTNVERMKRNVDSSDEAREEFNLPASFKGEVWSTDPLVGDNMMMDEMESDDIADHLNHLWTVYNDTKESECVQSHLCDVVSKRTAEYLTGKDSSIAILLASVSNIMGVPKAGQMVDDVIQTMVIGSNYACPSTSHCLQAL